MIEGGSSKEFARAKGLMHGQPGDAHALLAKITEAVIAYLKAQVNAGAQSLMVFDTWGGALSTPDYLAFSLGVYARDCEGAQVR